MPFFLINLRHIKFILLILLKPMFFMSWQAVIGHPLPPTKTSTHQIRTRENFYINTQRAPMETAFRRTLNTQNPNRFLWYPKTRTRLRDSTWSRPEWLYQDSGHSPQPLQLRRRPRQRRRPPLHRMIRVRRSENLTL